MARLSGWVSAASFAASVLVASASWAAGTPVDQATKEQLQAAQRTFEAADVLFDAKRYDEAITAFRASHEIVASPNSRLMIARSLRELGRYSEAWTELEGAIADGEAATKIDEKYQTTTQAARDDLARLKQLVARVTLKIVGDASAPVALDGQKLDAAALARPLVLAPGKATLTAAKADGTEARVVVDLQAGTEQTVELDLRAAPPPPPPAAAPAPGPAPAAPAPEPTPAASPSLRTWAFVAGGVGVAGLATFGVFGALNNSKFSSLEDDCPDGRCAAGRQDDIDAGRRYQTIANVGLAVGIVGLGAGTVLYVLGGRKTEQAALAPELRLGPGSVSLGGRFQ